MTSALAKADVSAIKHSPIRDDLIVIDASRIDVSEVSDPKDKAFLQEQGAKILHVVAKAALEIGRYLVEIQDQFKTEDNPRGWGLAKYYESLGITQYQVSRWTCKYRAYCAYLELFGEDDEAVRKFNQLSDRSAGALWSLPTSYREALLADIYIDEVPTTSQVEGIANRPEVKLSKAEELLAQAKARKVSADERWETVKADPDIPSQVDGKDNPEYQKAADAAFRASKSLEAYTKKLEALQAELATEREANERLKEERVEAEKAQEKLRDELDRYKFDETAAKEDRRRRVSNALLATIPTVHADLQRFYTEIQDYDNDTVLFLEEQIKLLKSFVDSRL